jgi:hypothetical protein
MVNSTPQGQLKKYLIGDLEVARRHLNRILYGQLPPSRGVVTEILNSIQDCVERIERDIK